MSCGLTRIRSRIKLAWFVFRHPEWKCKPWCLSCRFFDVCLACYEAETGETIEGIPIEPDDLPFVDDDGWIHISDSEWYQ